MKPLFSIDGFIVLFFCLLLCCRITLTKSTRTPMPKRLSKTMAEPHGLSTESTRRSLHQPIGMASVEFPLSRWARMPKKPNDTTPIVVEPIAVPSCQACWLPPPISSRKKMDHPALTCQPLQISEKNMPWPRQSSRIQIKGHPIGYYVWLHEDSSESLWSQLPTKGNVSKTIRRDGSCSYYLGVKALLDFMHYVLVCIDK